MLVRVGWNSGLLPPTRLESLFRHRFDGEIHFNRLLHAGKRYTPFSYFAAFRGLSTHSSAE
jgi:hypothetical protein